MENKNILYSRIHLDAINYIEIAKNYYALKEEWYQFLPDEQHLILCICISERRKKLIFTGQSACVIYNIPRLDYFEMRPHCITFNSKSSDLICWREKSKDIVFRTEFVNGLYVVSPMYAICDLLKYDSKLSILASINHCLNKKLFTKSQLLYALETYKTIKWKNKLLEVIDFATDKCDSPLETLAWYHINNTGLMLPEQQINIYDNKNFVGRVDMYWEIGARKIILELDGMVKYKADIDFKYEKIREHKLRYLGYEVIRATWTDVKDGKLISLLIKNGIPERRYYKRTVIR